MTGVAVFLGIIIGVLGLFLLYCLSAMAIAFKKKLEGASEKKEQDEKNAAASNFKKKHKK